MKTYQSTIIHHKVIFAERNLRKKNFFRDPILKRAKELRPERTRVKRSQNIFHQVLVTLENSYLATSIWLRGWINVASDRVKVKELPVGLGQGMSNFDRKG